MARPTNSETQQRSMTTGTVVSRQMVEARENPQPAPDNTSVNAAWMRAYQADMGRVPGRPGGVPFGLPGDPTSPSLLQCMVLSDSDTVTAIAWDKPRGALLVANGTSVDVFEYSGLYWERLSTLDVGETVSAMSSYNRRAVLSLATKTVYYDDYRDVDSQSTIATVSVDVLSWSVAEDTNPEWPSQITASYQSETPSATRGGSANFPDHFIVVAAEQEVVIYDVITGTPEMWMVFLQIPESYLHLGGIDAKVSSCGYAEGVLFVGENGDTSGTRGLLEVHFNEDYGYQNRAAQSPNSGTNNGNITQRNDALGWDGVLPVPIISDLVNQVDAVALGGPADRQGGLKTPTWAVATAVGVSVGVPGGNIYDITTGVNVTNHAAFTLGGALTFADTTAGIVYLGDVPESDAAVADWYYGQFGSATVPALIGAAPADLAGAECDDCIAVADASGLSFVSVNIPPRPALRRNFDEPDVEIARYEFTEAKTQVFFDDFSASDVLIDSWNFNAFNVFVELWDFEDAPIEIYRDEFDRVDVAPWYGVGGGTPTIVSEQLIVDAPIFGGAAVGVPTTIGQQITARMDVIDPDGGTVRLAATNQATGSSPFLDTAQATTPGTLQIQFTATAATTYFVCSNQSDPQTGVWDNLIVEESGALDGWVAEGSVVGTIVAGELRTTNPADVNPGYMVYTTAVQSGRWYKLSIPVTSGQFSARFRLGIPGNTNVYTNGSQIAPIGQTTEWYFKAVDDTFLMGLGTTSGSAGDWVQFDDVLLEEVPALADWSGNETSQVQAVNAAVDLYRRGRVDPSDQFYTTLSLDVGSYYKLTGVVKDRISHELNVIVDGTILASLDSTGPFPKAFDVLFYASSATPKLEFQNTADFQANCQGLDDIVLRRVAALDDWRAEGNVTLSVVSEELVTTTPTAASPGYAQQEIATPDQGVSYSFTLTNTGGFASGRYRLSYNVNGSEYTNGSVDIVAGNTDTFSFITQGTTLSMGFGTNGADIADFNSWDDVTVERVPALDGWITNASATLQQDTQRLRLINVEAAPLAYGYTEFEFNPNDWYRLTADYIQDTAGGRIEAWDGGSNFYANTPTLGITGTYSITFGVDGPSLFVGFRNNIASVGDSSLWDNVVVERMPSLDGGIDRDVNNAVYDVVNDALTMSGGLKPGLSWRMALVNGVTYDVVVDYKINSAPPENGQIGIGPDANTATWAVENVTGTGQATFQFTALADVGYITLGSERTNSALFDGEFSFALVDPTQPVSSPVTHITTTYNTGPMVRSLGAWANDTSASDITGPATLPDNSGNANDAAVTGTVTRIKVNRCLYGVCCDDTNFVTVTGQPGSDLQGWFKRNNPGEPWRFFDDASDVPEIEISGDDYLLKNGCYGLLTLSVVDVTLNMTTEDGRALITEGGDEIVT